MTRPADEAIRVIQRCVAADRVRLLGHFRQRMAERGMVWPDVLAVVDRPGEVRAAGEDEWGRPRWIIRGVAPCGLDVGIVCVIDRDDDGRLVVFITLYWES